MEKSLQILMEGLIDYAGLFPPASLGMSSAVRNYAAYRKGAQAPWLGRFVLPVSRLEEFNRAASEAGPSLEDGNPPWRLSALIGTGYAGEIQAIAEFNRDRFEAGGSTAVIDAVEMKAERAEDIAGAMEKLPAGITAYFEIPLRPDPAPLVAAIAAAGGRAKARTGGVTKALIPPPAAVARFIAACAKAGVPFKATAGLHHPIRSVRRLTYEAGSAEATMHGFLNVFLAAAFAADGMGFEALAELLQEESPRAFAFRGDEVEWNGHRLDGSRLSAARRDFAIAFGSCSFEEPRDDLLEAGLL